MKKNISMLLSLLLISLVLCSCGSGDSAQEKSVAEEKVPETHYTEKQTEMGKRLFLMAGFIQMALRSQTEKVSL